jgi:hypothetical protein
MFEKLLFMDKNRKEMTARQFKRCNRLICTGALKIYASIHPKILKFKNNRQFMHRCMKDKH